jgi:peptidoglycan/LPS O-acetylase OafA/YrhL
MFISGLRGYSALAVFFIHTGGMGLRELSSWTNQLVDMGRYGVISFFVLSAVTLSMSIANGQSFSFKKYMIRRFARIFPMYFVAIVVFWSLGGAKTYLDLYKIEPRSFLDLFMHLSFLNMWTVKFQNTILGSEWTIPIEMWTYLVIPPFLFVMKKSGWLFRLGVLSTSLFLSIYSERWHDGEIAYHWALENYTYCFILGIIVYCYWSRFKISFQKADALSVACMMALVGLVSFNPYKEQLIAISVAVLVWSLSRARRVLWIFENKTIIFFGNISFSFYLLHLPILEYLRGTGWHSILVGSVGLLLTALISYLTYQIIEKPFIKILSHRSI